jgi:hypothetical protein
MLPERVKLEIESQINGFESTVLGRLVGSFSDIASEAKVKKQDYLDLQSRNFNPETSDEGVIAENAYFEEYCYLSEQELLKTEFLNSSATWLFHLFERQKKTYFGTDTSGDIQTQLLADGYDISQCPSWNLLNKELRTVTNAVKHGAASQAAQRLKTQFPHRLLKGQIVVDDSTLNQYISALRVFWAKALHNKIVL